MNRRQSFHLAITALIAASAAQAGTLYWDGTDTNGNANGGAGVWNGANLWDTLAVGGADATWTSSPADFAVFGGAAGAVTTGAAITTSGIQFNTTGYGITATATDTLSFTGTSNILFNNIAAATITGTVGGSGANVVLSTTNPATAGTLTLNGTSTGGWSGTTTINAGMTLALAAGNQGLFNTTGGITLGGGNITLTNTTAGEALLDRVSNSAGITSAGGGTFTWTNTAASARVYAETIGSVDLTRGQLNFALTTNQGSGSGNKQTLTLGTSGSGLTRTGATNTSAVSFGSASGLNTTTNIIEVFGASGSGSSGSTASVPIIGPWASYGTTPASPTDYAVYDASGRVLNANIFATAENSASWTAGGNNVTLSAGTILTGTRTLNTLRYTGGAQTLNLGASNNLETYGLLNGGSGLTISTFGTGALTTPTGGGYLYLTPGNAAITVTAPINDNGGAVTVVKSGNNTLTLSSTTSNYSGGTVVNAGTLTLGTNSDANLGAASGGLTFNGTATLGYSDGLVLNGNRTVTINAGANVLFSNAIRVDGILTGSGAFRANTADGFVFSNPNNDFSGTITSETAASTGYGVDMASIGDGVGAGLINLGSGTFRWIRTVGGPTTFSNRQFALSGTTGAGVISSMGSQTLTINKDLLVTGVGNKTLTLAGTNNGINVFAGNIANGANGGTSVISLTKNEAGTWALSGTNTYSGPTQSGRGTHGTLIFQGAQALSDNTTLQYVNTGGVGSSVVFRILHDTSSTVTKSTNLLMQLTDSVSGISIFVGNNGAANGGNGAGGTTGGTIALGNLDHTEGSAGRTSQNLTVDGANGYRLQINNVRVNLNAGTTGNYTAIFTPNTAPITIAGTVQQQAGAGAGATTTLNLAGTTFGIAADNYATGNLVTGNILNSLDGTPKLMNVSKTSSSTWTLSGTNSYTGTTSVSGGLLRFTGNSSGATGAVTVSGGAIGGTGSLGGAVTLSVGGTGGIDLRNSAATDTLTLGSTLAINGAAGANNLFFDFGNGVVTSDLLSVAGTTSVTTTGAAVININHLGGAAGATNGTYTLIGGAGTLDATNFAKFSLATTAAFGKTYGLVHDTVGDINGNLQVTVASATAATPAAFWAGGGTPANNWSTTGNWRASLSGNEAVAGAPDYQTNVTFSTTTPSPANLTTNVLDADFNINSLTFRNDSGIVTIGGTKMLTIEASGGTGIDSQKTTGTNTISAKVGLASTQTWTVAAGGTLSVSGAITDFGGGYGLTKAGGGTLTLTGTNTFSGPLVMNAGTLSLGGTNLAGFGSPSSVNFSGNSTIAHTTNGTTLTLPAVQIDPGFTAVFDKGGLGGGGTFTFSGALTGSGTLSFASGGSGNGTFNLNNAGAFTGTVQTSSYTTNGSTSLNFASLGDAATISHGGTAIGLTVNYTGSADLTFTTRQFVMASSQGIAINNNGVGSLVINQPLSVTAAGTKTLTLGGTNNVAANTFAGLIANGSGTIGLTKADAGTWTVSNTANSYTGVTTISGGILSVSKLDNAGSNSSIGAYATPGAAGLVLSGGTLRYTGSAVATNRGFTQSAGSGINIGGASAASLTFGDSSVSGNGTVLTLTGTPGSSLTISGALNNNTTASNGWNIDPSINLTISGVMSGVGGITRRTGAGSITLNNDNNSFTGLVSTNGGSGALIFTSIADYGVNSALGRGTSGVAIALGGNVGSSAPLTYIGDGDSSNRQFALDGTPPSILNNGTGALTFTGLAADSSKFIKATQTSGARTLTLGGTYTGAANLISGTIDDNDTNGVTSGVATVAIAKAADASTWKFSGTNTYTGGTTVNGGTLQFAKLVSQPASGAVAVKEGATLAVNLGGTGEWDTGTSGNGTIGGLLAGLGGQSGGTVTYTGNVTLGFDTTNAGGDQTYSGVIGNVGTTLGITKLGAGALILDQANTYTGATTVDAGTLLVNGSTSASSVVTVGTNGTLGGIGIIGGSATIQGNLLPGNSPGLLDFSTSLVLSGTSSTTFEINGTTRGTDYDGVNVGTSLNLGGSLIFNVGATLNSGTFDLFAFGTKSGDFADVSLTGSMGSGVFIKNSEEWKLVDGANTWTFTQTTGDLALTLVPEAGTAGLVALGLLLLRRLRRR